MTASPPELPTPPSPSGEGPDPGAPAGIDPELPAPEPVVASEPEPPPEPVVASEPELATEPVVVSEPEPATEPVVVSEPAVAPEGSTATRWARAAPNSPTRLATPGWRPTLTVFLVVAGVYTLVAWNRVLTPSPQFHFVDLAESFLHGRLDTDTPRERSGASKPTDPPGYREALKRLETAGGWNDWSSLRKLTLSDGEVVRGRFPWEGSSGEQRHLFWTDDNRELKIDVTTDLARTCGESHHGLCDERIYYVSFPPVPALVFLPLVAVFGYDTNDVLVTILVGALDAVLVFWFLQLLVIRGYSRRSQRDNLWLTYAFAFGTVMFFTAVRGEVWFTALIFGVALNMGFILAALDLAHPVWAGIFLGLAFGTRTPILFCVVFFAWQLFFPSGKIELAGLKRRWRTILVKGTQFAVPLGMILVGLALYNKARFGEYGEFGHEYLSGSAGDRVRDHGMFGWVYLNRNLLSALVAMPRFSLEPPFVMISNHGLGLLPTSPFLFLLFWPRERPAIRTALWLAVLAAAVPGLFYQNTGWVQFGFRFAIDFLPYLMGLLAIEGRPLSRRVKIVIAIAIVVNLFGAITFGRGAQFYYETVLPGAT